MSAGVAFEIPSLHGQPLRGDLLEPAPDGGGTVPVVVVCHGFKGFKNWGFFPEIGARLAHSGFAVVLFNFSGSGIGADLLQFTDLDGFARDTMSRQLDDLGRVLDALHARRLGSRRLDLSRLAVLGHSRGGATAILRAREDPRVHALVTWASVSTLWRYSEREVAAWKREGSMEFLNTRTGQRMHIDAGYLDDLEAHGQRFDVLAAVAALSAPILLVHGEEDLSVPVQEAHELHAATRGRGQLLRIPRAGHTFGAVHPWQGTTPALDEALRASIEWLHHRLPGEA